MITMSNMNFHSELTIVIHQLPYIFSMAKAVSLIVELVDCVSSNNIDYFNFTMCTVPIMCFPVELVSSSDGWRRT